MSAKDSTTSEYANVGGLKISKETLDKVRHAKKYLEGIPRSSSKIRKAIRGDKKQVCLLGPAQQEDDGAQPQQRGAEADKRRLPQTRGSHVPREVPLR